MSGEWVDANTIESWNRRAEAGGPDHTVADCGSEGSHLRRLEALLRLPLRSGDHLEDLGCGTGRLADLLPREISYEGLDWSEQVIALARTRRPDRRFRLGGVGDLAPADWIVASGPFNYARGWSREDTAAALRTMWDRSRRGIAVTVLRAASEDRLAYAASELIGYLEGCDWVHVRADRSYLPNDLCVAAWRTA